MRQNRPRCIFGLFFCVLLGIGCSKPASAPNESLTNPTPGTATKNTVTTNTFATEPRVVMVQNEEHLVVNKTGEFARYEDRHQLAARLFKQDVENNTSVKPWVVLVLKNRSAGSKEYGRMLTLVEAFRKAGYLKVAYGVNKEVISQDEVVPEVIDLTGKPKLPADEKVTIISVYATELGSPGKITLEHAGKRSDMGSYALLNQAIQNKQKSSKKSLRIRVRVSRDLNFGYFLMLVEGLRDLGTAEVQDELLPAKEDLHDKKQQVEPDDPPLPIIVDVESMEGMPTIKKK